MAKARITLPDGRTAVIDGLPDRVTQDQIKQLLIKRPDLLNQKADEEPPNRPESPFEYNPYLGMGIEGGEILARPNPTKAEDLAASASSGAVASLGSMVKGTGELGYSLSKYMPVPALARKLIPGVEEQFSKSRDVYSKVGEFISDKSEALDIPEERQGFDTDVAKGIGSLATSIASYLINPAVGTAAMMGMGAGEQAERMEVAGAKDRTAKEDVALITGAGVTALTERLAIGRILGKNKGIGALLDKLPRPLQSKWIKTIGDIASSGGAEGLQEVTEGIAQDAIEHLAYNPDAKVFEGKLDQRIREFAVGSVVGSAARTGVKTFDRLSKPDDVQADVEPIPEYIPSSIASDAVGMPQASPLYQEIESQNKAYEESGDPAPIDDPAGVTAIYNAAANQTRKKYGLDKLEKGNKKPITAMMQNAQAKGLDSNAEIWAEDIVKSPRPVTDEEQVALALRETELENAYESLVDEAEPLLTSGDKLSVQRGRILKRQANETLKKIDMLHKASRKTGTELGRAMLARRALIGRKSYTYAGLSRRLKVASEKDIEPSDEKFFRDQSKKIRKVQKQIDDLENQLETRIYKQTKKRPPVVNSPELTKLIRQRDQLRREVDMRIEARRKKSFGEIALDVASVPRTYMAMLDMSATLLQGSMMGVSDPKSGARAFGKGVQAMFSQNKADDIMIELRRMPEQNSRDSAGLYLSEFDVNITEREEHFMSNIAEKIPVMGNIARASSRAMVTQLNALRANRFDAFIRNHPDATPEQKSAFADYVNKATGRGDLGKFNQATKTLNTLFFAPRFAVSRFQTLYSPVRNFKDPMVRNEIAKDFMKYTATGMSVLTMAAMAGVEVGMDPEEADFGKIVLGNTRINVWGGFQQPVRAVLMAMNSARHGMSKRDAEYGKDAIQLAGKYMKYKMGPTITVPYALTYGKNIVGQEQGIGETVIRSLTPFALQEGFDVYMDTEDEAFTAGMSLLNGLGAQVQNYDKR